MITPGKGKREKERDIAMRMTKEESKAFGEYAEQKAMEYLLMNGYTIRERNWRPLNSHLEIDIIAQKDGVLVFVEVKARTSSLTDPADAVDGKKIKRLFRAANIYYGSVAEDLDYRFDIITVTPRFRNGRLRFSDGDEGLEESNSMSEGMETSQKGSFAQKYAPALPPPTLVTEEYILDHIPDAFTPRV